MNNRVSGLDLEGWSYLGNWKTSSTILDPRRTVIEWIRVETLVFLTNGYVDFFWGSILSGLRSEIGLIDFVGFWVSPFTQL